MKDAGGDTDRSVERRTAKRNTPNRTEPTKRSRLRRSQEGGDGGLGGHLAYPGARRMVGAQTDVWRRRVEVRYGTGAPSRRVANPGSGGKEFAQADLGRKCVEVHGRAGAGARRAYKTAVESRSGVAQHNGCKGGGKKSRSRMGRVEMGRRANAQGRAHPRAAPEGRMLDDDRRRSSKSTTSMRTAVGGAASGQEVDGPEGSKDRGRGLQPGVAAEGGTRRQSTETPRLPSRQRWEARRAKGDRPLRGERTVRTITTHQRDHSALNGRNRSRSRSRSDQHDDHQPVAR